MAQQIDPLMPAGTELCRHCNGYGSSLNEASDRCTRCGGARLVTRGERGEPKRGDSEQHPLTPPE